MKEIDKWPIFCRNCIIFLNKQQIISIQELVLPDALYSRQGATA